MKATDYTELPRAIADCLERGGAPLNEDQQMMLTGYLAQWQAELTAAFEAKAKRADGARGATNDRNERNYWLGVRMAYRDAVGECAPLVAPDQEKTNGQ